MGVASEHAGFDFTLKLPVHSWLPVGHPLQIGNGGFPEVLSLWVDWNSQYESDHLSRGWRSFVKGMAWGDTQRNTDDSPKSHFDWVAWIFDFGALRLTRQIQHPLETHDEGANMGVHEKVLYTR